MIKILIIEDNNEKLERLIKIIFNYDEISNDDVDICSCLSESKQKLRSKQYDLVILDLHLPNYPEESPVENSGLSLLREIHERSVYIKPKCILGLSAYTEAVKNACPDFENRLWSIIHYDPVSLVWSERLSFKIEYLIEMKKDKIHEHHEHQYTLGILTALPTPEFDAVLQLSEWMPLSTPSDSTRYIEGKFKSGEKSISVVAACAPQMGMPAAAVTATKMISLFSPKYICMVGITAGVEGEVQLGDVIVADPSWDWGSGKLNMGPSGTSLIPDPLPERLDPQIRAMLRDASLDSGMIQELWNSWKGNKPTVLPKLYVGPCASGASVVADQSVVKKIQEHNRKLIGIEMEAYGLMHAASHSVGTRPLAFSMKAVCDFANSDKSDDIQAYASFLSAQLLKKIALKYF